jgi:hypothetical protein
MTPQGVEPTEEQNAWMINIVRRILASKPSDRPENWLQEAQEKAIQVVGRIWNSIGMLPMPPSGHSWVLFVEGTRFALTSWNHGDLAALERKSIAELRDRDLSYDGQVLRVAMDHNGYASNWLMGITLAGNKAGRN